MKLSTSRESLLTPLQAVIGVVERRQTMPVLANVLLQVADDSLAITATDLEVELVARSELDNVEVPGGSVQILLAEITTIDPPFEAVEQQGARFIDLTQARGLPPVEMEMLRHAYELVLGG